MNNDDERDYAEEAYNRELICDPDPEPDPKPTPGLLRDIRQGVITDEGRKALRDAGYQVNEREAYPTYIIGPPAWISGLRVIGWAEVKRRENNYPGGIVLAVDGPAGPDRYVIWNVYTTNGGASQWAAYGGQYVGGYDHAWELFADAVRSHAHTHSLAGEPALGDTA